MTESLKSTRTRIIGNDSFGIWLYKLRLDSDVEISTDLELRLTPLTIQFRKSNFEWKITILLFDSWGFQIGIVRGQE